MQKAKLQIKNKKLYLIPSYLLSIVIFFILIGIFYLFPSPTNAQYTCDCMCNNTVGGKSVTIEKLNSTESEGDDTSYGLCQDLCNKVDITKSGGMIKNCQQIPSSDQCADDGDCTEDKLCSGGVCTSKTLFCKQNSDCPSTLYSCLGDGKCHLVNSNPVSCEHDGNCPISQKCSEGKCINKSESVTQLQCSETVPCPEGQICESSKCVIKKPEGTTCEKDDDCPTGQKCAPGLSPTYKVCKANACTNDSNCPSGQQCATVPGYTYKACIAKCTIDMDCAESQKCNTQTNTCEEKEGTTDPQAPSSQYVAAGKVDLKNPLGDIDFLNLVGKRIIPGLLGVIGAVAVVAIIWGGFSYITSRGDEKELETAKHVITYAIVGLIFALLSYILINTIVATLGG